MSPEQKDQPESGNMTGVLTAFAGSVGAVTDASLAATTLNTLYDLLSGKQIIEVFNGPDYSGVQPDGSYSY